MVGSSFGERQELRLGRRGLSAMTRAGCFLCGFSAEIAPGCEGGAGDALGSFGVAFAPPCLLTRFIEAEKHGRASMAGRSTLNAPGQSA